MGRKRPDVEVLGLISFTPLEVTSCPAGSAGVDSNSQPRLGPLISVQG